jgi:hypothetical protein
MILNSYYVDALNKDYEKIEAFIVDSTEKGAIEQFEHIHNVQHGTITARFIKTLHEIGERF